MRVLGAGGARVINTANYPNLQSVTDDRQISISNIFSEFPDHQSSKKFSQVNQMKTFIPVLLASLTLLTVEPAMASHRHHKECFETYTRWKHGWYDKHGYYRPGRYVTATRHVICEGPKRSHHHHIPTPKKPAQRTDDNSCIEGSVLGGIAGGGLGAALSKGDGRWWAIPSGIVGGALVGCQIDGG